tara:strand:+ start:281 stop:700 length:420 start_codon:yes stop_codon:yes gene_type:complete
MKKYHRLDCSYDYAFKVLAISSHSKAYKLCWHLNQKLNLSFEKINSHKINESLFFTRYKSKDSEGNTLSLFSNRSKNGFLIPSQKSVNYFMIINKEFWNLKKDEFLGKLRAINDILLVFELDLQKEKNSDRFVIHDKKD